MDALTLDQFVTFVTVADEGSFAAAARRMRRAQSAITYAIQKLEEQSGAALFDRSSYRPQLTETGRSLLPHARRMVDTLTTYRMHARAIAAGVEAEVRLMLPEAMPPDPLVRALTALRSRHPTVQVRLITDSAANALHRLEGGTVDLAIVLNRIDLPAWFRRWPCTSLPLVAVASPGHALARVAAPISPETLADHLQIVVTSHFPDGSADYGVVAVNRWYATDHSTKRQLLLAGLGWGSMPAHLVEDDIACGRLLKLTPSSWDGAAAMPNLPFVVGVHGSRVQGPASQQLLAALGHEKPSTRLAPHGS